MFQSTNGCGLDYNPGLGCSHWRRIQVESGLEPSCKQGYFYCVSVSKFFLASRNIFDCGFERSFVLPSSHLYDSVLCSAVADIDWDGRNELLVGTYGKVCVCVCVCEKWALSLRVTVFLFLFFNTASIGVQV